MIHIERRHSIRSVLRATAMLGASSLVSLGVGLVSAKASAVLLGPRGVGHLGLLQSTIGLTTIVASVGVCGLVRELSRARAAGDAAREIALRTSAWILSGSLGAVAMLLTVAFRGPLGSLALGGPERANEVPFIAGAIVFTIVAGVHAAVLNAHQRVGDLARLGVGNSLAGVAIMLPLIAVWRERGLAWGLLASAIVSAMVAAAFARRAPIPQARITARQLRAAARTLLAFGGPYTASALVGTGVQLAIPILVLHQLGASEVGFYRAASGISVTYLGFLIAALGQDYYPRVSAAGDRSQLLVRLINDQHRVVLLIAGPLILFMLALVPVLVPVLYSREFAPAAALLEWQLAGDVFKFAAFTMSYVILAQRGSLVFFVTELASGGSLWLLSSVGMARFGLEGLGGAFLIAAAFNYVLCWMVLRRAIALRWTPENRRAFAALVLGVAIVRAMPALGLEHARLGVALTLAVVAAARSLSIIWVELGGGARIPAREGSV